MNAGFLFIELLLAPIRAAGADDSDGFFISISERYRYEAVLLRYADNDKAIFL